MPKVGKNTDTSPLLKPFTFHGVLFHATSGNQAVGTCPLCDREGKLYVNQDTGLWDCKICQERGRISDFLEKLYERSANNRADYDALAVERKILNPQSLADWGLVKSIVTDEWMLPGYGFDSKANKPKLKQLYLWRADPVEGRMRFICQSWENSDDRKKTAHGVFLSKWDSRKPEVAICEGLWDGIAFEEALCRVSKSRDAVCHTAKESLYTTTNVIAVPGANVFYESWCPLLSGKDVTFYYDSDHERKHPKTDALIEGSGIAGVKRSVGVINESMNFPESISYLKWGEKGFDPDLPNRYDVRDHLSKSDTEEGRAELLLELFGKVEPIPDEWKGEVKQKRTLLHCTDWNELVEAWKAAMYWNDGLYRALGVMLACAASVQLPEDQLWVKIVSPASTGKTELAEALAMDEEHIHAVTIFKGLHSGQRMDDGRDCSLISVLGNKTLIVKDADTLLQMENKEQILSEFRDAYDRNSSTHYRNGVANSYKDHSFTVIICGTQALAILDESELGQRFLDCVIMDKIDTDTERSICRNKLAKTRDLFKSQPIMNGKGSSTAEKLRARQMTGGYLRYLRHNIADIISNIDASDEALDIFSDCGQFVAYFRARPSKSQSEEASREMSARLSTQHCKLGYSLAAVMGKREIDAEVIECVRRVSLDTARGTTLNIAKQLYPCGNDGLDVTSLSIALLEGEKEVREILRFLRKIEVVECFQKDAKVGIGTKQKWRLTPNVRDVYERVYLNL